MTLLEREQHLARVEMTEIGSHLSSKLTVSYHSLPLYLEDSAPFFTLSS